MFSLFYKKLSYKKLSNAQEVLSKDKAIQLVFELIRKHRTSFHLEIHLEIANNIYQTYYTS